MSTQLTMFEQGKTTGSAEEFAHQQEQIADIQARLATLMVNPVSAQLARLNEPPEAWTTGEQLPDEEHPFEFELVLIPFIPEFRYLWSSETKYNTRPGPKRLWTRIEPENNWLDPLRPLEPDHIHALKQAGLVKRYPYFDDVRNGTCFFPSELINQFAVALPSVTNVPSGGSAMDLYRTMIDGEDSEDEDEDEDEDDRNPGEAVLVDLPCPGGAEEEEDDEEYDYDYSNAPKWLRSLTHSIIPLRPGFAHPTALEYLPIPDVYELENWTFNDYNKPNNYQLVHDKTTDMPVRRLFFTTVEAYIGLTDKAYGQADWGMRYDE